ncbi:MAG: hypothetical protein WCG63_06490 [Opitutaceae bacterium]
MKSVCPPSRDGKKQVQLRGGKNLGSAHPPIQDRPTASPRAAFLVFDL